MACQTPSLYGSSVQTGEGVLRHTESAVLAPKSCPSSPVTQIARGSPTRTVSFNQPAANGQARPVRHLQADTEETVAVGTVETLNLATGE